MLSSKRILLSQTFICFDEAFKKKVNIKDEPVKKYVLKSILDAWCSLVLL
jgi:hypothetical protein